MEVIDNKELSRFEAQTEDGPAFAEYRLHDDDVIEFTHTEVPAAQRQQGVAATIARAALDSARERKLHVKPSCAYIEDFIQKNAEYQDLVSEAY